MKNKYKEFDDYTIIYCSSKKGQEFEVFVDNDVFDILKNSKYSVYCHWTKYAGAYYATITEYIKKDNSNTEKPRNKSILLHRMIMNCLDNKKVIDHIDNNALNNRRINMRIVEESNNLTNRKSKNSNNTSGYRNVSWGKNYKKWIVQLQINGKNKVLKYFAEDQLEEAHIYAEKMRGDIYGEYAGKD